MNLLPRIMGKRADVIIPRRLVKLPEYCQDYEA
jgi:hypothetical protein